MPFAGDAYGGEVVGVVRVQRFPWLGREVQHAVGEVDQVLMAVQVGNGQRTQVGDQVLQNLVDRPHPDQLLVVCCNEALDHPQHHVVRVLAETAVLVDVLERPSGGVVAHNQILKVLSAVTRQKRHRDAGNPAGVKGDERGGGHDRFVEHTVACFECCRDGQAAVILALPLVAHQGASAEDCIDEKRIITGPERDERAQGAIGSGVVLPVLADVPSVEEHGEFLPIGLPAQCLDDLLGLGVAGLFGVVTLWGCSLGGAGLASHITLQRGKDGLGAIRQRHVLHHILGYHREPVGESAQVEFQFVVGIFHVVTAVETDPSILIPLGGNPGDIVGSQDVHSLLAYRELGIGVEPLQQHLHEGVLDRLMVDVEEEHILGDDDADSAETMLCNRRLGLGVGHPGGCKLFVGSAGAACNGAGDLGFLPFAHHVVPADPEIPPLQLLHRHSHRHPPGRGRHQGCSSLVETSAVSPCRASHSRS